MEYLIRRILNEATVEDGNIIRLDSFLSHQLDVELLEKLGKELARHFKSAKPDKVLTAESSGIALAAFTAQALGVPAVYAKRFQIGHTDDDVWSTEVHSFVFGQSYTLRVSKKFLAEGERILVVDDILSNGQAILGLLEIIATAGAESVGVGVVLEKGNRDGGSILRSMGLDVKSLVTFHGTENGTMILE